MRLEAQEFREALTFVKSVLVSGKTDQSVSLVRMKVGSGRMTLFADNKEAYALAAKMSDAWISFARTGNPNHKGLPNWPAYSASKSPTMHFNNTCVVKPQMDRELFTLLGL